ncbi:MAG: hypothetical protein Q7R41_09070 [Phycisphaerales bacterium]|nr:hypothetical protein [Phycisphaerales bacterium]
MMKQQRGIFKRAYDAIALLALLNIVGLVGVVGVLAGTGALTKEKARSMVEILRAPKPSATTKATPAGDGTMPAAGGPRTGSTTTPQTSPALSDMEMEVVHREAERIKAEIDQRLALANSIMLKVRTEREAFHKDRDTAAKQEQTTQARQQDEGFRKEIAILESLSSKMALQHLLGLNDPDQAAKTLMAMDTDRAKKIVESAKRGEDLQRMKVIVQRLRDASPNRGDDFRAEANGGAP